VLGPTLWNVLFDDVMELEVPEGVSLVCYADDLAIVVTATTREDMILEGNETLHRTKLWMAANNLIINRGKDRGDDIKQKMESGGDQFQPGEPPHKPGGVGQVPGSHFGSRIAIRATHKRNDRKGRENC
jgi:hypothetical protein